MILGDTVYQGTTISWRPCNLPAATPLLFTKLRRQLYLLTLGRIQICDSLLLAIDEEYVEGVELLLEAEERLWRPGTRAATNTSRRLHSVPGELEGPYLPYYQLGHSPC